MSVDLNPDKFKQNATDLSINRVHVLMKISVYIMCAHTRTELIKQYNFEKKPRRLDTYVTFFIPFHVSFK